MSQLSKYAPEDFWSGSTWVSSLQNHLVNEGLHAREFLMPRYADRTKVKVLPCYLFQAGPFEEFRNGSFAEDGHLALVDIDRNTLDLVRIDDADDTPSEPKSKEPRQPTGSPYGMGTSPFDLAARFFPDFAQTTGRYRLQAILPLQATTPVAFEVGGAPSAFSQDLASSLEAIPDRKSIPPELLREDQPWKALAAPPSLGEGLRARLLTESDRHFLDVDFALPELEGERLHLEPGAVLPSGNRPPDAVKWIHILAAGEEHLHPTKVLLPVVASAEDALLRGHARIELQRLYPGLDGNSIQSVYIFSGAESVGPLELPAREH
ncbi:MAG: hypothetical protein IPK50_09910 [Fibrobacterota bacterium]|nr:hypothetical protein [Fibrobacterota bacterium]QQS07192.1 MAG: hypothetical protein IPK50_09910 [Fibrobacterota bacterium]